MKSAHRRPTSSSRFRSRLGRWSGSLATQPSLAFCLPTRWSSMSGGRRGWCRRRRGERCVRETTVAAGPVVIVRSTGPLPTTSSRCPGVVRPTFPTSSCSATSTIAWCMKAAGRWCKLVVSFGSCRPTVWFSDGRVRRGCAGRPKVASPLLSPPLLYRALRSQRRLLGRPALWCRRAACSRRRRAAGAS